MSKDMTAPLLSVERLTMRFGGLAAIDDLSLAVPAGKITGVIGPNGAGKTTFFNCLTGFYKPTEGVVCLNHPTRGALRLADLPSHQVARTAQVVRTFQNIRLFPRMTVLENLIVAQHNVLQKASQFSLAGILGLPSYRRAEAQAVAKAVDWLTRLGLIDKADTAAGSSRHNSSGSTHNARAISTRRCVPYGKAPAGVSALSIRLRRVSQSTALATACCSAFRYDGRPRMPASEKPDAFCSALCCATIRFSSTVIFGNRRMFWKVRTTCATCAT